MFIQEDTLDDLLHSVFRKLLKSKNRVSPTKGSNREEIGVLLKIKSPRARMSRTEQRSTLGSCLGESLWYLSGSAELDFIEHYIPSYREFCKLPPDATISDGAYGPRLFGTSNGFDQVARIIQKLRQPNGHDSRKAVIQIFDKSDWENHDVPCTCTLQFFARGDVLHLFVSMRSNDAYRGLPHDVFAFTWLQEFVARSIEHEIGTYTHAAGSLHLYDSDENLARRFVDEGWQEKIEMPAMPLGDPWQSLSWLLKAELGIRKGGTSIPNATGIDTYWVDLARLLLIMSLYKAEDFKGIVTEKRRLSSPVYEAFVRGREKALLDAKQRQLQLVKPDGRQLI